MPEPTDGEAIEAPRPAIGALRALIPATQAAIDTAQLYGAYDWARERLALAQARTVADQQVSPDDLDDEQMEIYEAGYIAGQVAVAAALVKRLDEVAADRVVGRALLIKLLIEHGLYNLSPVIPEPPMGVCDDCHHFWCRHVQVRDSSGAWVWSCTGTVRGKPCTCTEEIPDGP